MADNFGVKDASGVTQTLAFDEIGGSVKHQRVKIQVGADGSASDVSDSNPMPVDDAGGSLTVDDGGSSLSVDDNGSSLSVDDNGGSLTVDVPNGSDVALGNTTDVFSNSHTATSTVIQALKGLFWIIGARGDSSATSDTGTFSLTAFAKRAQERWTALLARLPASLGQKVMSASLPVVIASDQSGVASSGDVAHDAADLGSPIKVGGKASSSTPTMVADGDRVNAYFDRNGRLAVQDGGGTLSVDDGGGVLTVDGTVSVEPAKSGIAFDQLSVSTGAGTLYESKLAQRSQVIIHNKAASNINVALDSGMTDAFPILPGERLSLNVSETVDLYFNGDSGGLNIRILEIGS